MRAIWIGLVGACLASSPALAQTGDTAHTAHTGLEDTGSTDTTTSSGSGLTAPALAGEQGGPPAVQCGCASPMGRGIPAVWFPFVLALAASRREDS